MMWKWTALCLMLFLGGRVYGVLMDKYDMAYRMDGIQQDMEILGNELHHMETKMDLILKHLDIESAKDDFRPALELLNGTRKVISEEPFKAELTVYFRNVGHDDDIIVKWIGKHGLLQGAMTRSVPSEGGATLWTTSMNHTLKDTLTLRIESLDLMLSYRMEFANRPPYGYRGILTETNAIGLPSITFQLLNGPDFVYEDNEIVTFKIQTSGKDEAKYSTNLVSLEMETIPEGSNFTETITCKVARDKFCEVAKDSIMKLRDHMTYEIKIHTRLLRTSRLTGFTTLKMLRREKEADLKEFEMQQKVVIKPRGQRGPYPDGFVTVSSPEKNACDIDKPCLVDCIAYGDQLKEVKAFNNATPEEMEPIYSYSTNLNESSYIMETYFEVLPPAELNLTTQKADLTCRAITQDGETAETSLAVKFEKAVKILTNESYVAFNGTTLTVQCVATGYPMPNPEIEAFRDSWSGSRVSVSIERDQQNLMVKAIGNVDNPHDGYYQVNCIAYNRIAYVSATIAEGLAVFKSEF